MDSLQAERELIWKELPTLYFVSLTKGKFAVIDAVDAPHISCHKWSDGGGYAFRFAKQSEHNCTDQNKRKRINMHHVVCLPSPGKVIDHINRLRTDNRRKNLRECTAQQNLFNQAGTAKSGFKGVYPSRNSATACDVMMRINGKLTYIGYRPNAVAAAELYDLHALKHQGEFCVLNFPEKKPQYLAALSRESAA